VHGPRLDATRVRIAWYGARRSGSGAVWDSALVALCGPRPVVATTWVVPDEKGAFRASGLERGPHRVRVETGFAEGNVHPDALAPTDVMADATSRSVELSIERATIRVTVSTTTRSREKSDA